MSGSRTAAPLTILLCCLAAVFEGIDLQSMGIAAPQLIPEFHLTHAQFGTAASMSLAGLLIGAVVGGHLADRIGRTPVLLSSLALMGIFSLLTTRVAGYQGLLLMRGLVGLGLGGTFPMLLTIVSELAGAEGRATPISLMYAGMPLGTVIGTLMTLYWGAAFQWRWFFYLGGVGPLVLVPVIATVLRSRLNQRATRRAAMPPVRSVWHALFGERRAGATLLLWAAFFFTLSVISLLTNWLNQLMAARGLTHSQATIVLLGFGAGSVAGALSMGAVADAGYRRGSAILSYAGVAICVAVLATAEQFALLVVAALLCGLFAVGAQLVNYTTAPGVYASAIRGTGAGWAVAAGRFGAFCGPIGGGYLLTAGLTASTVLLAFVPGLLIAGIAATATLTAQARGRPARP